MCLQIQVVAAIGREKLACFEKGKEQNSTVSGYMYMYGINEMTK